MNPDLVGFELNRQLNALFPDHAVLVTDDFDFDLVGFAQEGRCVIWTVDGLDPLLYATWKGREKGTQLLPQYAFFEVLWNGCQLRGLVVTQGYDRLTFLISEDRAVATRLFEAVCLWSSDAEGRITVFDGRFRRDSDLERAIKDASWDSLVLPSEAKERLYRDVTSFFSSKETYERYGMVWKRGVLLYGPPGNGKTHAIKALVKETGKPCLVVRSLKEHEDTDERAIARVFKRARQMAPAILLFEDIDSLVSRSCLSALLNELDGIANNAGLLCLATTNHLSRLDVALSNRPSRFDRKYLFANPKTPERLAFLQARFGKLDEQMRPSTEALEAAAKAAKGFSGAMLQELVATCAMVWMSNCAAGGMDKVLNAETVRLKPVKVLAPA